MKIDAHHHLWDLQAVSYPWLMAKGEVRFFGDPAPIQRNYLIDEHRRLAGAEGFGASVHIQVGAADAMDEARWVQSAADANPDWPMVQIAACDLTAPGLEQQLDALAALPSVRGVRQIVGRAPEEDARTGSDALLDNPAFKRGLKALAARGFSFDLQLIPELTEKAARVFACAPELPVALCHAGSPHDRSPEGLTLWARRLKKLSAQPQFTCKISGLGMFDRNWAAGGGTAERWRPIFDACLEQFGPGRCMFGSNFPVDSLTSSFARLMDAHETLTAGLNAEDRSNIFGDTAQRFYRFALP